MSNTLTACTIYNCAWNKEPHKDDVDGIHLLRFPLGLADYYEMPVQDSSETF